jgi:hypothetical protein
MTDWIVMFEKGKTDNDYYSLHRMLGLDYGMFVGDSNELSEKEDKEDVSEIEDIDEDEDDVEDEEIEEEE